MTSTSPPSLNSGPCDIPFPPPAFPDEHHQQDEENEEHGHRDDAEELDEKHGKDARHGWVGSIFGALDV